VPTRELRCAIVAPPNSSFSGLASPSAMDRRQETGDYYVPRSRAEREASAQRPSRGGGDREASAQRQGRGSDGEASRGERDRSVSRSHRGDREPSVSRSQRNNEHEEEQVQQRSRSVLVIMLGQTEVHIPGPACGTTARTLAKALQVMRDCIIDEDSAKQALDIFEAALSGPLQYKGAHLCLAEIYIAGSAPQIGKDYRRAVTELVTFLEVSDSADYREVLGQEQLFDVARETARVAQFLDASGLGPISSQLTRLASEIPMLQGTALRACLLRLERIDGAPSMALALKGAAPPPPGPLDFLHNLLKDMNIVESENSSLKVRLEEERGKLALFANTLEREQEKRLEAEELVCRFSASAQHLHKANERLAERIEGEVLRADKAEQSCATAEVDSDELRREIIRLRKELELERRKGLLNERDLRNEAATDGQQAMGATTARGSPDPRKTVSGTQSARQSPGPDSRSVPQCLQGYENVRRTGRPTASPSQDYMQVSTNQEQELRQWMARQQTGSPAPRDREPMHSTRQASASPTPAAHPPMLRERHMPNGRAGSATGKRDAIDADRKHLRSSLANGVLHSARANSENIGPQF